MDGRREHYIFAKYGSQRLFPEWRESVWGKDFLGWGWGGMLLRSKIA